MDTLFFLLSKTLGILLLAETWLALGLLASTVAAMRGKTRGAAWGTSLNLAFLLCLGTLPLGEALIKPLEREFPPREAPAGIHGIIILGGVEDQRASAYWGQPQINAAAERLTAGATLALQHPQARVVFTGGSGRLRDARADAPPLPPVAIDLLTDLGIDRDRILWEDRSRNTAENARLSRELVAPDPEETWVLVTSAFHMGRARASFEAAGWSQVIPFPVDYRSADLSGGIGWGLGGKLDLLNIAVRERIGRLVYRLTER